MNLSSFREDSEKQRNGTPIYIGDATFYIRRFGTPESKDALKEIREKVFGPMHKWTNQDDEVLTAHWLVEFGVVGWEGVQLEENGEELKYSKRVARSIFLDPEYYLSLNAVLVRDAMSFEAYLYDAAEEDIEALKKN